LDIGVHNFKFLYTDWIWSLRKNFGSHPTAKFPYPYTTDSYLYQGSWSNSSTTCAHWRVWRYKPRGKLSWKGSTGHRWRNRDAAWAKTTIFISGRVTPTFKCRFFPK